MYLQQEMTTESVSWSWSHLDLGEGDLKAEALVEIRIQGVLFDRRLLLLQPLSIVLQHDFHKGV